MPDGVAVEALVLEDLADGRTRMVAMSLVESFEDRDALVANGMERRRGPESYDRPATS
jgi:hypothetical protein